MVDGDEITAEIDGSAYAAAKAAAMRAHATQIAVDGEDAFFALSNDLGQPLLTAECYQLVRAFRVRRGAREDDLFAGLPEAGPDAVRDGASGSASGAGPDSASEAGA